MKPTNEQLSLIASLIFGAVGLLAAIIARSQHPSNVAFVFLSGIGWLGAILLYVLRPRGSSSGAAEQFGDAAARLNDVTRDAAKKLWVWSRVHTSALLVAAGLVLFGSVALTQSESNSVQVVAFVLLIAGMGMQLWQRVSFLRDSK